MAGFEPAASAFQARPSTGLTLHPELVGRGSEVMMAFIVKTLYRLSMRKHRRFQARKNFLMGGALHCTHRSIQYC